MNRLTPEDVILTLGLAAMSGIFIYHLLDLLFRFVISWKHGGKNAVPENADGAGQDK